VYIADQIRTRWRHVTCRRKQAQEDPGFHSLPLRQSYSTPEGLVKLQGKYPLHNKSAQDENVLVRLSPEKRNDSFSGFSSAETSPKHSYRLRSYSLSVKDPRIQVIPPSSFSNQFLMCVEKTSRNLPPGVFGMAQ
jgi:hypothetical protein